MLAEREMTTMLVLLRDIARHLDVKTSVSTEQICDLGTRTNIYQMVGKLRHGGDATSRPPPHDQ